MAYLLDSGFLYAQLNDQHEWHDDVSQNTEVAFLLDRRLGLEAVARFSATLVQTNLLLEMPISLDLARTAEILRKYVNIDFVDALIVAIAERLNITKILTVDRRHFQLFRPAHCTAFEILP